jgi:hypothetical protein
MARRERLEELMSDTLRWARRPAAAARIVGLGIAAALAVSGCGGGGSAATSTPPQTTTSPAGATAPTSTTATSSSTTSEDSGLSGKWSGTYSGAYSGTFKLDWQQSGSKLSGTIDLSTGGTVPVHGTVDGSSIKFGTVGGPGITYTGTVSGDSMSGDYTTPNGGGSWSADRSS